MAEREMTWHWSGQFVQLGDDGDTLVPAGAHLVGRGLKGAPDLEARFEVRDGVPECVEFTLRTQEGGRSVRSADLRLFNIDGLTFNAFMPQVRRRSPRWNNTAGLPEPASREWWAASRDFTDAQQQRRSASDAELEEVARIYRAHLEEAPTKAVEVGMNYSPRTAARRVQQARAAGLLPQTSPGKKKG